MLPFVFPPARVGGVFGGEETMQPWQDAAVVFRREVTGIIGRTVAGVGTVGYVSGH